MPTSNLDMSLPSTEDVLEKKRGVTRRRFLQISLSSAFATLLAACTAPLRRSESPSSTQLRSADTTISDGAHALAPTPVETTPTVDDRIAQELSTRVRESSSTLAELRQHPGVTETHVAFEVPIKGVQEVADIRAIENMWERFWRAALYLGVQTREELEGQELFNPRYNNAQNGNAWMCNIYAQQLTQLLLGEDVMSHRLDPHGKLFHVTYQEYRRDVPQKKQVAWLNSHPELDANMMDKFMPDRGQQYGWTQVISQEELFAHLRAGYICYATENLAVLKPGQLGHNLVIGWSKFYFDAVQGGVPVISQASFNKMYYHPALTDPKLNPQARQFHFFVHPPVQFKTPVDQAHT